MFQLLKAISALDAMRRQVPLLLVSLFIADSYYRFHSFVREAGAFLVTWFVLDLLVQAFLTVAFRKREDQVGEARRRRMSEQ